VKKMGCFLALALNDAEVSQGARAVAVLQNDVH